MNEKELEVIAIYWSKTRKQGTLEFMVINITIELAQGYLDLLKDRDYYKELWMRSNDQEE